MSHLVPYITGTVFDNMLLCGFTTVKTTKNRIVRNEQLYESYYSTNIIRMNKSTRMSWTGHAARMLGEMSCCRNLKERVYFEDPEVEGWVMCKTTLKEDETA